MHPAHPQRTTPAIHLPPRLLVWLVLGALTISCSAPDPAETAPPAAAGEHPAENAKPPIGEQPPTQTYAGSTQCAQCHSEIYAAWQGSHHDLALQAATAQTVLADFNGHDARFILRDGQYAALPEPGGQALPIVYTFGVEPLQQYVVATDSGHLQVLPTPWDVRPAAAGGQRFYELYPGDYPPGDPMHWQGRANNWNGMCADCHSTGVEKHYDEASASYATEFAEEDVACEACHGPASRHIEAARAGRIEAVPMSLANQAAEINACAPCHSRRSQLAEGFRPDRSYFDHYRPSLLSRDLYHPDGQILDEVYVYGSFLQTPMHREGVTCSNCHDPHTATLRLPGNETCTQCHNPAGRADFPTLLAKPYDDPSHHFHPPGTEAAACVSCHMTSATYMGIDDRRDHSFRIPRPDLSINLSVPNACNGCHSERSAQWAADVVTEKFGPRTAHFGSTFALARSGMPAAEPALAAIAADKQAPVMVRASAVAYLNGRQRGHTLDSIRLASRSPEPLLRIAATEGAGGLSPDSRWRLLSPLLDDPLLAVRSSAFSSLLEIAADPEYRRRLLPYFDDYVASLELTRDFPETQVNLANAYLALGNPEQAEAALNQALTLQPGWVPALINLADVYRQSNRDEAAGTLLQRAVAAAPEASSATYSYGLWLIRQQRAQEAVDYFRVAAQSDATDVRYGYTYALALNETGQPEAAVTQLERLLANRPDNEQLLLALITILRDENKLGDSLRYAERLLKLRPDDQQLRQLRDALHTAAD